MIPMLNIDWQYIILQCQQSLTSTELDKGGYVVFGVNFIHNCEISSEFSRNVKNFDIEYCECQQSQNSQN